MINVGLKYSGAPKINNPRPQVKSFASYKCSDLCQLIIGSKHCLSPLAERHNHLRTGVLTASLLFLSLETQELLQYMQTVTLVEEMWRYVRGAGQRCLGSWTAAAKWANIVPSAPRTDDVIANAFLRQEPNKCCSKKEQSEFDMCTWHQCRCFAARRLFMPVNSNESLNDINKGLKWLQLQWQRE